MAAVVAGRVPPVRLAQLPATAARDLAYLEPPMQAAAVAVCSTLNHQQARAGQAAALMDAAHRELPTRVASTPEEEAAARALLLPLRVQVALAAKAAAQGWQL